MSKPLDLDVLQAEATFEPFRFTLDAQERELPHVQTLSTEQALQVEAGQAKDVIVTIAGQDLADRLMKLPAFAMNAVLEGWLQHAGLAQGE